MDKEKLLELTEGKNVDLKKAKNNVPDSFWDTYSAFANTDGGLVVFGVDEKNNEVTGVDDPYKLRDDLFNLLNNTQKVSANIIEDEDVRIINLEDGTNVIFVHIPEAPYNLKPIYLKNNPRLAYERLGEGDRKLSTEKYKALVVGSHEVTDNELLKNYDIGDLNEDDLEVYKKLLFDQTKNEKYLEMSHEAMLIEIGALRKDRQGDGKYYITTGGLLFFGKFHAITDRYPGFQLDYFEKESSLVTDWVDRISTGDAAFPELNVFSFLRLAIDKLKLSIKDEFVLDESTKMRLPFKSDLLTSVREALVNSLMHAYYDSDTPIRINAYPDYYEFINPGKMRITVDEFIHGGNSNIRNHTMSSIMRRIGISEKAGSGGPRIFDVASKYRLKLPEVIREQNRTVVRIWKVDLEKTFETYPEEQQRILYYLVEHQSISRSEANEKLSMENHMFRTTINDLLEKNMIDVIGKGRSTRYVFKLSSPEQSYGMKRLLRLIEDNIVRRDSE